MNWTRQARLAMYPICILTLLLLLLLVMLKDYFKLPTNLSMAIFLRIASYILYTIRLLLAVDMVSFYLRCRKTYFFIHFLLLGTASITIIISYILLKNPMEVLLTWNDFLSVITMAVIVPSFAMEIEAKELKRKLKTHGLCLQT